MPGSSRSHQDSHRSIRVLTDPKEDPEEDPEMEPEEAESSLRRNAVLLPAPLPAE